MVFGGKEFNMKKKTIGTICMIISMICVFIIAFIPINISLVWLDIIIFSAVAMYMTGLYLCRNYNEK